MKFLHRKIFIAWLFLVLYGSCKKENSIANNFLEVNGQKIQFQLKDATLLVNPNANLVGITTETNATSDRLSFFIQNNNSTTVDCIDQKNYDVSATGWNGSAAIDNCAVLFVHNSKSYTTQLGVSGVAAVTKCDNTKLFSVNFSGWLYAANYSDSLFISNAVFENIQLIKQ